MMEAKRMWELKSMQWSRLAAAVCLLFCLVESSLAQPKDMVTITSEKTAVVDKLKGTAVWLKNVHVIRKLTGSNLLTDRLSIKRDLKSGRVVWAEAAGNVKALYFKTPVTPDESPAADSVSMQGPHTTITCDLATFERSENRVEMKGNLLIQSRDFELRADKARYQYQLEKGEITPLPGEQVRFVYYKKTGSRDPSLEKARTGTGKVSGVADEILVDRQAGKSVLQGKVSLIDHTDQSRFKADRAVLLFDRNEELETVIASGNFVMNQPNRLSRAERALFEYDTEEVTLIGNAYVKEDSNNLEVSSARIKMYLKVDRGIISGVDDVPVKMQIEIK